MALIYKIVNKLNGKCYVGKTELSSVEERFKQHGRDYKRAHCENRPLYRAINKYGIKNFYVELLEETDIPEEREMYYIDLLGTYGKSGYNATLGGDGAKYIETADEEFIEYYLGEGNKISKHTAEYFGVHVATLRNILKRNNIEISENKDYNKKRVNQYTKNGEYIKTHRSISEAALSVGSIKLQGSISLVCYGKRKTSGGYLWEFNSNNR